MDLGPVVNHIKSSFWIDLDDDQVMFMLGRRLESITSRSARNGLDLDHRPSSVWALPSLPPYRGPARKPQHQDLSTVAQLLSTR